MLKIGRIKLTSWQTYKNTLGKDFEKKVTQINPHISTA